MLTKQGFIISLLFFIGGISLSVHAQQELQLNPNLKGLQGTELADFATPNITKTERAFYLDKNFHDFKISFKNIDKVHDLQAKIDVYNKRLIVISKDQPLAVNFMNVSSALKVESGLEQFVFLPMDNVFNCFKVLSEAVNPNDNSKVKLLVGWETNVRISNYNAGLDVGNKTNTIVGKEVPYIYIENQQKFIKLTNSKRKFKEEIEGTSINFTTEGFKNYNLRKHSKLVLFFNSIKF